MSKRVKSGKVRSYRQGDVLLVAVKELGTGGAGRDFRSSLGTRAWRGERARARGGQQR